MRKLQVLGLALLSVFAFSAIAAGSAFAESEFLVGGVPAGEGEPVHNEGELTLIAEKQTFFNVTVKVRCSGLSEGEFKATGESPPSNNALLTKVFDLAGKELTELAGGSSEECVNVANCPEPLVYVDNLPWLAEVVLDNKTTFLIHLTGDGKGEPGYEIECMGVGLSNLCVGLVSGIAENLPLENDFDTIFSEAEEKAAGEGGTCTEGGPSYVEGSILALEVNGKAVMVS